jgi:hypothetical protein
MLGDGLRLPLTAPTQQTKCAETGGEQWECSGKWSGTGRGYKGLKIVSNTDSISTSYCARIGEVVNPDKRVHNEIRAA